jgi:hypothetical protein
MPHLVIATTAHNNCPITLFVFIAFFWYPTASHFFQCAIENSTNRRSSNTNAHYIPTLKLVKVYDEEYHCFVAPPRRAQLEAGYCCCALRQFWRLQPGFSADAKLLRSADADARSRVFYHPTPLVLNGRGFTYSVVPNLLNDQTLELNN